MKFVSTRGKAPAIPLSEALLRGLAPDGGLYIPEIFPVLSAEDFRGVDRFPEIACRVLTPFFSGDRLEAALSEICEEAFNFPLPLKKLRDRTSVLQLFHGPTAAFKDFGARFLASCLDRIDPFDRANRINRIAQRGDGGQEGPGGQAERVILVATSGDTGGAVAAAFHRKPGVRVVILYPAGGVSARQEKQLTGWGDNIEALSVRGTFDDCQKMVKAALGDETLGRTRKLGSANSINIGRLLPQLAYHAAASLWYWRERAERPALAVPTGNAGNSVGALWARRIGLPIRHVALATNANRVVPDYLESGQWAPRPSVATLANAMDVGNPSNMERILALFSTHEALLGEVSALSVSDNGIRRAIAEGEHSWGETWCPHTATAVCLRESQPSDDWIIVATAHPAKFETIVEPLVGHAVEVPEAIASILARPSRVTEIPPEFGALRSRI